MTYPMIQFPTVGEFIQKVTEEHGGKLRETTSEVVGPHGPVVFRYLERETEQGVRRTTPLPDDDNERIAPAAHRSFIAQLALPPRDFGYSLDTGKGLSAKGDKPKNKKKKR